MLGLFIVVTYVEQRLLVFQIQPGKRSYMAPTLVWVCGFVRLSFCPDFPLYLNNYFIKRIYMHIIRTASMRGLRLCALFVVSTYISRVIDENVRKMAKTKI